MNFIEEAIKHRNKRKILTEPLVAAYLHMNWQSLKVFFYGYWIFYILFLLVPLTLMTTIMDFIKDVSTENSIPKADGTDIDEGKLLRHMNFFKKLHGHV